MPIEQLKALLAEGKITQAEFDAKAAELEGDKDGKKDADKKTPNFEEFMQSDEFKQFIQKETQREADRVRTEKSKEIKTLEEQLNQLKTEKLTDEEKLSLREQQLAEQKRELESKQLQFDFLKVLGEQKLPNRLSSFVPGSSIEKKTENLTELVAIINEFVETKVSEKFGSQGHKFEEGKEKGYDWNKMSISEKIKLAETDIGLYNKLKEQNN